MKPQPYLLKLQPGLTDLIVFQFFFFLMHELHELVHITTGRLMCGGWGTRDFNVWELCSTCEVAYPQIAAFAGPAFTFAMLWLGRYWLKQGKSTAAKSWGLVFIFGNMPFGRIYMAAMGSGDELYGMRTLFLNTQHSNLLLIRIIGFAVVALICIPPLVASYRAIGNKWRPLIFIAFLIVPLVLDTVILLMFLNGLIAKGILAQVFMMGTPLLVTIWFVVCLLIVIAGRKYLGHFAKDA